MTHRSLKAVLLAAAASVSVPAMAQDHSGHMQMPMPSPAPAPAPGPQDHSGHAQPMAVPPAAPAPAPTPEPAAPTHDHMMAGMAMDHGDHAMADQPGMPTEGSGTSRLPAAEGMMPGLHIPLGGDWMAMAHGYLWGVYTDQSGPRGDSGIYGQSMAMLMVEKPFEGGRFQLKTMLSAEPLMSARGYPNLFATGETAGGQPLVDRQHPHDLFMELAARVDKEIAPGTTAFLYGGPVGEPALGPSAFMHRASAQLNPEAPITHHWFDSTHITYGVITAGLAGRTWQIEGSAFRGREPDENRWDIETPRLDSWSVRATLTPNDNWAMQISHGRIKEPEVLHPGEDEIRTTASINYSSGPKLAAMAAFSAKNRDPGDTLTAWLGEVNWNLSGPHTLFGRFENVANDELFPDHADPLHDRTFRVSKLQAGYAYTLPIGRSFALSLGGTAAKFLAPAALDGAYGKNPMGYTLFAKLRFGSASEHGGAMKMD